MNKRFWLFLANQIKRDFQINIGVFVTYTISIIILASFLGFCIAYFKRIS
jgi:hypothetical protein